MSINTAVPIRAISRQRGPLLLVIKLSTETKRKEKTPTGPLSLPRSFKVIVHVCRYAFAYAEKIERYIRHAGSLSDVFQPEIVTLRAK